MSENTGLGVTTRLLSKIEGNNRACRLIQYITLFLTGHQRDQTLFTLIQEDSSLLATKLQKLGVSMVITRKILRFGRHLQVLSEITHLVSQMKEGEIESIPKAASKLLSLSSLSLLFLFDHILFLKALGWIGERGKPERLVLFRSIFWLLKIVFSLIWCVFEWIDIKEMGVSSVEKKRLRFNLHLEGIKNILDAPIAFSGMYPGVIPSMVVGVLGTITSIVGIYQILE